MASLFDVDVVIEAQPDPQPTQTFWRSFTFLPIDEIHPIDENASSIV